MLEKEKVFATVRGARRAVPRAEKVAWVEGGRTAGFGRRAEGEIRRVIVVWRGCCFPETRTPVQRVPRRAARMAGGCMADRASPVWRLTVGVSRLVVTECLALWTFPLVVGTALHRGDDWLASDTDSEELTCSLLMDSDKLTPQYRLLQLRSGMNCIENISKVSLRYYKPVKIMI